MRILYVFILMALSGCVHEDTEPDNGFIERQVNSYSDWISRETWDIPSLYLSNTQNKAISYVSVSAVSDWAKSKVSYAKSNDGYWQSSNESLTLGRGNCVDIAILTYVVLLNLGYDESRIDCFIVKLFENGEYIGNHCIIGFYVDGYQDARLINGPGIMIVEDYPLREYKIVCRFNRYGFSLW